MAGRGRKGRHGYRCKSEQESNQCRRLAAAVNYDRAVEVLLALAEKFETRAAERTAREGSEKAD
jgi:hypothetical protein